VTLAERDDSVEALLCDGPDEPLGIGIQIRAPWRQPDRLDTCPCRFLIRPVDSSLRAGGGYALRVMIRLL